MIDKIQTEEITLKPEEKFGENQTKTEAAQGCAAVDNRGGESDVAAESADAEQNKENTAAAYGKFKSAEALLSAYLNLEAEFTRRSQKLKELESKAAEAPSPKIPEGEELLSAALHDEKVKNAVVGEYLKTVLSQKSVPLLVSGAPCAAPKCEPKSIKEAGALAKQFLKI